MSLKDKANPLNALYAVLIDEIKGLKKEQEKTNTLLKAKNEFDKKTHKSSTKISLSSLLVGCCALYIALRVAGFDGDLIEHIYSILKQGALWVGAAL